MYARRFVACAPRCHLPCLGLHLNNAGIENESLPLILSKWVFGVSLVRKARAIFRLQVTNVCMWVWSVSHRVLWKVRLAKLNASHIILSVKCKICRDLFNLLTYIDNGSVCVSLLSPVNWKYIEFSCRMHALSFVYFVFILQCLSLDVISVGQHMHTSFGKCDIIGAEEWASGLSAHCTLNICWKTFGRILVGVWASARLSLDFAIERAYCMPLAI